MKLFMRQPRRRSAHVRHALSRDHTVLPVIHDATNGWTISAFAFPIEPGSHLLTPRGMEG